MFDLHFKVFDHQLNGALKGCLHGWFKGVTTTYLLELIVALPFDPDHDGRHQLILTVWYPLRVLMRVPTMSCVTSVPKLGATVAMLIL
jgi:hypothetical protein